MKRKYFDREDWSRFLKKRYIERRYINKDFDGYVSLLNIDHVSDSMSVLTNGEPVKVVDNHFKWLQFAPLNTNYIAMAIFDDKDVLIKWYIDIVLKVGQENDRLYYDDLYVDVSFVPGGLPEILDEDELEEALTDNLITQQERDLALLTGVNIHKEINKQENYIINNYRAYLNDLLNK